MKKILMFSAVVLFALPSFCADPIVVKIVPKKPAVKVSAAAPQAAAPVAQKEISSVKKASAPQPKIVGSPISFNIKGGPVVGKEYIFFLDKKYFLKDMAKNEKGWVNDYYLDKETKDGYVLKMSAFEEIKPSKTEVKAAAEKYIGEILSANRDSQCFLRMFSDKKDVGVVDCLVKPKKGSSYYIARKYTSANNTIYYTEYAAKVKDASADIEKLNPSRESVIQNLFLIDIVPVNKSAGSASVNK